MPQMIHIFDARMKPVHPLQPITESVRRIFHTPATSAAAHLNLSAAYDASRQQYHSTALLSQILAYSQNISGKCIALVDVDLYIPVLTFVYGEAQLDGPAAVISTFRLHNEFYGLPHDEELYHARIVKEVVHELGHTFGLYHCHQFECVMRSSTYVEEIDLKQENFCEECGKSLHAAVKKKGK